MANSLLDFVMSLVRDPDAAARYAADPGQAITDADLTDVTSVDVNQLIPVVAESLSAAVPTVGGEDFGLEPAGNVWASGAATAAFDAFGDFAPEVPAVASDNLHSLVNDLIEQPDGVDVPALTGAGGLEMGFDVPVVEDAPLMDTVDQHWSPEVADVPYVEPVDSGFDIFD